MLRPSHSPRLGLSAALAILVISLEGGAPAGQVPPPPAPSPRASVNPTAPAVEEFMKRINEYVALHKKLEDGMPKLPKEATPEQIDKRERELGARIQAARATAKPGDLFTPEMTAIVKRVMAIVLKGPEGQKLRSSIMDENVKDLPLKVNQRFPTIIPMATMPPEILKALPELPEEMQYRFVSSQFVLLDPHANIVADFIPGVIPVK